MKGEWIMKNNTLKNVVKKAALTVMAAAVVLGSVAADTYLP